MSETPPAPLHVAVLGTGLWMPGYPDLAAWRAGGEPDEAHEKPKGLALDRINRRRAGILGRAIADAAAQAMEESAVDASTVPSIVGSSIGEAAMIGLLEQMWRTKEPMSPAAFTVSVHNASSGLLSISSKNQGYATSLAADEDTPGMALIEGLGVVHATGGPVLVVCGDEEAPRSLVQNAPHWDMLAAAVVLGPVDQAPSTAPQLTVLGGEEPTIEAVPLQDRLALSPQAGMIDLLVALQARTAGRVRLDRGTGRGYVAELTFPA